MQVTCRHKNVIKILFSLISKHYYILIQLILSYKQFMNQMWNLFNLKLAFNHTELCVIIGVKLKLFVLPLMGCP
jgi:hypothetical protein